jgi:hypothetical protein
MPKKASKYSPAPQILPNLPPWVALQVQCIPVKGGGSVSARAHYGLVCAHHVSPVIPRARAHTHTHTDCTPVELVSSLAKQVVMMSSVMSFHRSDRQYPFVAFSNCLRSNDLKFNIFTL